MNDAQRKLNFDYLKRGLVDGIPIGLVYFAVSFSLGITARNLGMTSLQGFFMSLFTIASAGEYAGMSIMAAGGSMLEMVVLNVVTNIRYILMGCALSQRFDPKMPVIHRLGVGALITDEIFAIQIGKSGFVKPFYAYGAGLISVPLWALGTMLGIIAGNIMPARLVSALSVALYGMFIGIVVGPARESKPVAYCVAASYALSWAAEKLLPTLSSGTRTIILIVLIASIVSLIFPVQEDKANE